MLFFVIWMILMTEGLGGECSFPTVLDMYKNFSFFEKEGAIFRNDSMFLLSLIWELLGKYVIKISKLYKIIFKIINFMKI